MSEVTETVDLVNVEEFKKELRDYVKIDAKNKLIQCINNLIKKNINKGYCEFPPLTINFQGIDCELFKFPTEWLNVIEMVEKKYMVVANKYLIFDSKLIKSIKELVEKINSKNRILLNIEHIGINTEDLCNILYILTTYDISIQNKYCIICINLIDSSHIRSSRMRQFKISRHDYVPIEYKSTPEWKKAISRINEWKIKSDPKVELDLSSMNLYYLPYLPSKLREVYCGWNHINIVDIILLYNCYTENHDLVIDFSRNDNKSWKPE